MTRGSIRFVAALLIAFLPASRADSGLMAWWEDHLLDVEIVSCVQPSVRNVHLLKQMSLEEPLEPATLLAHLPPGRIIRARVLRSRIREGSIEPLITGADAPAKMHPWQSHSSRRPTVYFVQETGVQTRSATGQIDGVCERFPRGARMLLVATTASDCDTVPFRGRCVLDPLSIAYEAEAGDRADAAR